MIRQRPYQENDLERVLHLLITYRGAGYVNRYPTVWRLKLLMSSRLWDKRDAALWEDEQGEIIGFVMLSKRHAESTAYGLERVSTLLKTAPKLPKRCSIGQISG